VTLENAYGRWLAFLAREHPQALSSNPIERVTRQRAAGFCRELEPTNAGISVGSTLRAVRRALQLMQPGAGCDYLLDIAKRLEATSYIRPKRPRMRPLLELYRFGLSLMREAEAEFERVGSVSSAAAIRYRDGLIIAILVEAPMRRSNLVGLIFGGPLQRVGPNWIIVLAGEDMKTGKEIEYVLSQELSLLLDRYVQTFRSVFLNSDRHEVLWASVKGCPMGPDALYLAVCRRTRAEFGEPMNPHLFRDAAATFWAEDDPGQVHLVRDLLGHANPRTAERHYNHANGVRAARVAAEVLATRVRTHLDGDKAVGGG
jgi:integrase